MSDSLRLPKSRLKLTIQTFIVDQAERKRENRLGEDALVEKLWREEADEVRSIYRDHALLLLEDRRDVSDGAGLGWRSEQRRVKRAAKKAGWTSTYRRRPGLTVSEIAERLGLARATLVALMDHHGFTELAYHRGKQRRRMVTKTAFEAGLGHNVDPSVGRKKSKLAPHPVFYEDRLGDILWCFDLNGIRGTVAELDTKRKRMAWLLESHGYLPNGEVARMAGCSVRAVVKARRRDDHGANQGLTLRAA